jgi:lipoprotein-anchoring transpeptidase ErfK/SrfK
MLRLVGLVPALVCAALLAVAAPARAQAPPAAPAPAAAPAAPPLEADGVVSPGVDALLSLRSPGDEVRLSDETTITRWAYALKRAIVRATPSGGARPVAKLKLVSASLDGEIYGALRGRVDRLGRRWLRVRVPGRPNGRVGWAPATAFGPLHLVRTQLVVNRATLRATLYDRGRQVMRAPVGVGKGGTPTPRGAFFVDRKEGSIFGPAYGPNVFFTTAFSSLPDWPGGGVVGIHGTNQPGLVPGRPSHGCIRLHNSDIRRLYRFMPVGTPLLIR